MSQTKIRFSIDTKTAAGVSATTEVRLDLNTMDNAPVRLEEVIQEARRNVASRSLDYEAFTSDSAYLDALDSAQEAVTVLDITAPEATNHFFCRAHLSDADRRIFVRNIAAPTAKAAEILMIWELTKLHSASIETFDALVDFIGSVEVADTSPIASPDTQARSYIVSSPKGDDVHVDAVRPAKATMVEDVAEIFMLAAVIDPTINPKQFTAIQKSGPTARYFIEGDGDDYRDWVHATDTEEAEFHAACTVEANQSGNANEPVIESLGDFIEGVDETEVTVCHLDPVTRDELLKAVQTAIAAYDTRTGLPEAIETLRDMAESMSG